MISIHIEPQFEGLRREMKKYPSQVIEKATVRTLNKMGTKGGSLARKALAKHYGVPQKNFKNRIRIEKATKKKQHVKISLVQSRGSRSTGEYMVTAGTVLKNLKEAALARRIQKDDRFHGKNNRPFIRSPKGYPMVFARLGDTRYPLEVVRVNLREPWQKARTQMRSTIRANYATEWNRNARFYKSRMRKKYTR